MSTDLGSTASPTVERAATALGLRIVRRFDDGMFGAVLVEGRGDVPLVLKASAQVELAREWATGAAMAARLRAHGYPASRYIETGTTAGVTWSLQEVLPGEVPQLMTELYARELIGLVRTHAIDAGIRRPWDALARDAVRTTLRDLGALPGDFDAVLDNALTETADVELAQTTIVHGDFHHRNCLVSDGHVSGVFDWEIAGAGDWRFDLVCFALACQVYPKTCEPQAVEAIVAAVLEECDTLTARFLITCQTLQALSMVATRQPNALERASRHMQTVLAEWWE